MKAHRLALILALALPALAQSGVTRWGSYKTFAYGPDRVDRGLLNLHLEFPLFNRATVGSAQVNLRLAYDSNPGGWHLIQPQGELPAQFDDDGPCGWYDPVTGIDDQTGNSNDESSEMMQVIYSFIEPDGTSMPGGGWQYLQENFPSDHPAGWVTDCPTFDSPSEFVIPDGKGYTVFFDPSGDASAYDTAGNEIAATTIDTYNETATESNALVDPHGNQVTYSVSGGVTTYTDPLGAALTVTPSSTQVLYQYTGPNGNTTTITEDLETLNLSVNFGCSGEQTENVSPTLVKDLIYPDGTEYQFGYDSNGRVDQVTLPSGATINYSTTYGCTPDGGNSALSRVDSVNGGNGWNWSRTLNSGAAITTETAPDNSKGVYAFATPLWLGVSGVLSSATMSDASGNELTATNITTTTTNEGADGDAVTQQTTSNELYSASNPLYAVSTLSYTALGQTVTEDDYDWGPNQNGNGATLLRQTATTYIDSGYASVPSNVTVSDNNGTDSNTVISYDSAGDPLTIEEYTNSSTYLTKTFSYNPNGTLATATDGNGNTATYTYGACGGVFPTLVQSPVSAVKTSATWNCTGGVQLTAIDPNGNTTTTVYADPSNIWRPTQVDYPDGGETTLAYTPTSVEATRLISSSSWTDAWAVADALGRPAVTATLNGAGTYDRIDTCYNALGQVSFRSYPYQYSSSNSAPNCSGTGDSFAYDALGRNTTVTHSDGSTVLTSYVQAATEVQDEGNGTTRVTRVYQGDGLGRLASVCEVTPSPDAAGNQPTGCNQDIAATGFLTTYSYNGSGNLTGVTQGAETRSFTYDWLSRLTSATTPESGTTTYTYDNDSNVATRTRPAPNQTSATDTVTTTYTHDALDRVLTKSYSDGTTPSIFYSYDTLQNFGWWQTSNPIGRLVEASETVTIGGVNHCVADYGDYDVMGRDAMDPITTPLTCGVSGFNFFHTYDLVGDETVNNFGQGTSISMTYDSAQRLTSASDTSDNISLISGAAYNALGEELSATLGNGLAESFGYTSRGPRNSASVGSVYSFGGVTYAPDGDMLDYSESGMGTMALTYNNLNQLTSASCSASPCTGESVGYSFDRYGNRWSETAAGFTAPPAPVSATFTGNNNHLDSYSYDAAGNLTNDGAHSYQYDAENRLVSVDSGTTATYIYNPEGRRAYEDVGGVVKEFAYSDDGRMAVVGSDQSQIADEMYVGGRHIATRTPSGMIWDHASYLGTTRLQTNASGQQAAAFSEWPFGEWMNQVGPYSNLHYTGQYYDSESNLDYFPARYYNSQLGRFLTPDPAGLAAVDPDFPQSWNRYAYVDNSPLSAIDPTGEKVIDCMWSGCGADDCPLCDYIGTSNTGNTGGITGSYSAALGTPGFIDVGWLFDVEQQEESLYTSYIATQWSLPDTPQPAPTQQQLDQCVTNVLGAVNSTFNTSFTSADAQATYDPSGGEVNVQISGDVTAAQFNAISPGRYSPTLVTSLTGLGPSLHVPSGPSGLDRTAVPFQESNNGGVYSVSFTAHLDSDYATLATPLGALAHYYTDVVGSSTRNYCPSY